MLPAHPNDKLFSVLLPSLVHGLDKFWMKVKPLPPTVLAVAMPRLIDDIHLVAAVSQRDVANGEVLAAQLS
ncbi:MAG: hypothetical protein C5B59_06725 [Bacteroidetes bacterium]|nr:MAG: hypothetical protein C5B59_06725 [Bacteroidota bacterium]